MRGLIAVAALSACALAGAGDALGAPLDAALIERAVASLRLKLKDPGSAQFDQVAGARNNALDKDRAGVCGYVNAKNGFGGYVGRRVFAVAVTDDGAPGWTTTGDTDLFAKITLARCKAWGIELAPGQ